MACSSCGTGGGGRSSTSCSCKNMKSMDVKTPADKIANGDESFCFKEVTDKICKNLANDEGINPSVNHSNTDCEDLSALNDLGIGKLNNSLIPLNLCDVEALKEWLLCLLSWTWNINKAIVCAICGLWEKVKQLLNTDVGNHLSISSDKNTLTLSRKKLNGTAVASDNIPVGIGDINNNLNKLNNTDVGNHLSISSDRNTLTLTRKKLDGTVVASDNIKIGIGDLEGIIFSVIKFDYTILDSHVTLHLQKGEITNAGFVDVRLELNVTKDIPSGMYKIAKINEAKAQPAGSIINGVVIESTDYELFGSAAVRDEFIYMNTTKTISAGKVLHFSFAYRNFTPKSALNKTKEVKHEL